MKFVVRKSQIGIRASLDHYGLPVPHQMNASVLFWIEVPEGAGLNQLIAAYNEKAPKDQRVLRNGCT